MPWFGLVSALPAKGRIDLRLVVASPFLDRQHGTEKCVVEQIERLAFQNGWKIDLYCQKVDQMPNLATANLPLNRPDDAIIWHRVPEIPGPHLFRYLWWLFANHILRWYDRTVGRTKADLTYSPGINCFNADAIVVHIVFTDFVSRISSELRLSRNSVTNWHLVIHRLLYYRLAAFLEKRVYQNPEVRLAAVSNLVAKQLEKYFERTDVTVIPNAVDTNCFNPEVRLLRRESTRCSLGYSEGDFVLLLIGNDWTNKGLESLLNASRLLPDLPLRLLIVGSDEPTLYQPWIANLFHQVRFELPSSDVVSFYAAADLYVGPSLQDSFGLPIVEAMACGLPVIASVYAGASEIIRDGETGLLLSDPRDPAEIAGLIKRVYQDAALKQELGFSAAQYVQANCGWDQNVAKTRIFLESILFSRNQG